MAHVDLGDVNNLVSPEVFDIEERDAKKSIWKKIIHSIKSKKKTFSSDYSDLK